MAGRRLASTQDGPAKKKKKVKDPCHYCPAGDKRRSNYGEVDEKTKVWKYKCCREHFEGLKAEGKDVSKLVSRSTASALKNGKAWNSCQHQDCKTQAFYGPWNDDEGSFRALLCKCHYELAVAGSEALEALKKYINKNQARILRTGKVDRECHEEGCTKHSSYGQRGMPFTATHCSTHSDATMVSAIENLRICEPEKAAEQKDRWYQSARQRSQCPGTADGERCTHDAFLQHHQLRCAYCADGITADKMGPEGFHRKYEAAALEVVKERLKVLNQELNELQETPYTFKEEMAVLNCGFDKIEAVFPTARCDIMVTDLASAKVLESNSKAIRGMMNSMYKLKVPLHSQDYPAAQTKLDLLYIAIPAFYQLNMLPLPRAKLVLSNKRNGVIEIDEDGHRGYDEHNEMCRIMSLFNYSADCIVTLVKLVPDAHKNLDLLGWPPSPRDRLRIATNHLLKTMKNATKDNVTYFFYPANNKHISMARKTLLPRVDIDVNLNPHTPHTA